MTVPAPAGHQIFYAPPGSLSGDSITFPPDESAHMVASLRVARGDIVMATDGAGRLFEAQIEDAGRKLTVARVTRVEKIAPPGVKLRLYQGMIRPQRMDLIVEKCVELGVTSIVPVFTQRSLERDAGARLSRWKKIALEAMKQSLRVYLPEIYDVGPLGRVLEEAGGLERLLVAHEGEAARPLEAADVAIGKGEIGLFIGPEGGFSEAEMRAFKGLGATVFGMGRARLKSETAAIAAVALIRRFLQ